MRGLILLGVLVSLVGCATVATPQSSRDLPMLSQADEGFYRGGQPSHAGLEQLSRMGIKTVVCLRQPSKAMDDERLQAEQLGMRWVNLPMWFWWRPSDRQVRQFLSIVSDPAQRPVFIHCRQGWNRAGVMTAIYRIVYQDWEPRRAYMEARRFGLVPWNLFSRYLVLYQVPRTYKKES